MCFQHEFSHALSSILFIIAQARKKDELKWKICKKLFCGKRETENEWVERERKSFSYEF